MRADTIEDRGYSDVVVLEDPSKATVKLDAVVLAAGFEDRAFNVLPRGSFKKTAHCILIRFINSAPNNERVFEEYLSTVHSKFAKHNVHIVELEHGKHQRFETDLIKTLAAIPESARLFGIDVSGMPSYSMCLALKALRDCRDQERLLILYTSATNYNPSFSEYEKLTRRYPDSIELVPRSMALEMAENIVPDSFSGYRSQNAKSCLAVFAGYEVHRSAGIIEAINPALLLLLHGNPGDPSLSWRLELSRRLHRKFERGRRTATEVVSTLHIEEALDVLERYYNYLIDDYDLVISPICSKMHVVASYLFWERYGETQLTFPIPIGYDPSKSPKGVGSTYALTLEPRRQLFRGQPERDSQ